MEFWSSEVKSGETFKVKPGRDMLLHLSQASLGEVKKVKSNESVYLFVNVDGEKLVLGTLSSEKLPQVQFDLVFDRDFELYHSWKGGSVYFFGYKMANFEESGGDEDEREDESDSSLDSSSEDEDMPLTLENIGKPEIKVKEEKSADTKKVEKDSSTNKKAGVETDNGLPKSEDDDSSDDDDSVSDDDDTDVDEDEDDSDDEEGSEEDEDESEEDGPGKKRAADTEPETPASKKKAKLTTPEKTDGKKGSGVHVDTPHPSKKAGGKTSATDNQKTAKSSGGGSHMCKSCSRTFGSGSGLDSHTKAKHGADK